MQDFFSGKSTCIQGRRLPSVAERIGLQNDHERRLEALDRLGTAAAECGVAADPDRDIVTIPEDAVALLELSDPHWARLGEAIREWRRLLPLKPLEEFGFPAGEAPLDDPNPQLLRIGGGVEAWAYVGTDHSVYKFYRPIGELKEIGSSFHFERASGEVALLATARPGSYRELLEKLLLIHALGGMATEVVAVTPEGIVVAKQTLGEPLPQGDDMSQLLPRGLIEIPSRFLRANRDHPRLFFLRQRPYLVADLHARNFVRGSDDALHVIDLVASPWPEDFFDQNALVRDWLDRVRTDPHASALPGAPDAEL